MGLDMQSFDAALKVHYTNERVENMTYMDNPLFALMPKYENFGGRNMPIPVIYGNPQGRSATFAQAQKRGKITNSRLDDFIITRIKNYGIATIDNETLEASKGDANAFMEAATTEIDGTIRELTNSIAVQLYGNGSGARGVVGSIATTNITLSDPDSVVNFEVGMELVGAAAETTGAIRAVGSSGNGIIITGIDRIAGTLTFGWNVTDAANGIPTLAANDFLFVRGDRNESGGTSLLTLSGVEAWIPSVAPGGADNFFGVNRSVDITRMAGLRRNVSAFPIEEGLLEGAALVNREGGNIDHYFCTYKTWVALEKALGSKVQYVDLRVNAQVGFRGIEIMGQRGPIKVIPDRNCPANKVYGLTLNTWRLNSLGKAVRVIDTDGNTMLRQGDADGVEVRYGGYMQVSCRAPGWNINLTV